MYNYTLLFCYYALLMTCTLHTSQYRSLSNETSTCKHYRAGKTNQH